VASTNNTSRRDVGVVIGLALLGIAVLVLVPVSSAPTSWQIATAWLATLALFAAALWVPATRFRRWPAEARRASVRAIATTVPLALAVAAVAAVVGVAVAALLYAPGAGLVPQTWRVLTGSGTAVFLVAATVALTFALRPVTAVGALEWSQRKGLDVPDQPIRAELRRLRTWRTVPAVVGAAIGVGPAAAYNLWIDVHGTPPDAVATGLMEASMRWPMDPLTLALVGYLVGLAVAEATRRRPSAADGQRTARLDERVPTEYLTRPARLIPGVLAGVTAVSLVLARVAGSDDPWWPGLVAVGLAGLVLAAQRWVVRRPQRLERAEDVAVDDALRSSAAHGLTGGAGALLLITAAGAIDVALRELGLADGAAGGIVGVLLAVGLIGGVWALWLGYGSAHRGQVPPPPAPPAAPASARSPGPVA
jgi:hypothetical protein